MSHIAYSIALCRIGVRLTVLQLSRLSHFLCYSFGIVAAWFILILLAKDLQYVTKKIIVIISLKLSRKGRVNIY